jgi:hypothetical protein
MRPWEPADGAGMSMRQTSRRRVLGGVAAVAATGLIADAVGAAPAAAAPTPAAAPLPADPLAHLLRRATYGATPAALAEA